MNDSEGDNGEKGGGGGGSRKDRGRKNPSWELAIRFVWLWFHDDLNVMTNLTKNCIKAYWVFNFV